MVSIGHFALIILKLPNNRMLHDLDGNKTWTETHKKKYLHKYITQSQKEKQSTDMYLVCLAKLKRLCDSI